MNDIIREGHPVLTTRAVDVEIPLKAETKKILTQMRAFLIHSQNDEMREKYELRAGVGLAAPQINISKRMCVMYTADETGKTVHDYVMVNPRIVSHSVKETYIDTGEGCLSIDREVEGVVPRYAKVTIQTHLYDVLKDTLKETTLTFEGYVAIVFQHEFDHLNGILFTERIKPVSPDIQPIHFNYEEESA
jgi:peptide deformylase